MLKTFFTVSLHPHAKTNIVTHVIAGTLIWSVFLPLVLLHAWIWVYQAVYFSAYDIPKALLREYVSYDRNKLKHLTLPRKLSCAYCAYANGVIAWAKVIINRTETYSCAIKHRSWLKGNEHQQEFLPYEQFA